MREDVVALVDKAVAGGRLERIEVELFYALDDYSPEAYYLHWGAHEIAWQAASGQAAIYAQIGIDAQPCPGGCHYCSFARINSSFEDAAVLPLDTVLAYCQAFSDAGVHLVSLMTTAGFAFADFLEIAREARRLVGSDVALMANIGDFDLAAAKQLRKAGIDIIYHAIRIGEGTITAISEERRRATIQATYGAGLQFMSGVEPVYQGQDAAQVIDRMIEVAGWPLICSGIGPLRAVKGTRMAEAKCLSAPRYRLLSSLFRLMAGTHIPFGGENTRWCNAGTNPRDTVMFPGAESIQTSVAAARQDLQDHGWQVGRYRLCG